MDAAQVVDLGERSFMDSGLSRSTPAGNSIIGRSSNWCFPSGNLNTRNDIKLYT